MATLQEKLARIHNRATLYELAAINGDQRILISYANNQSRRVILKCAQQHGQALIDMMGISNDAQIVFLKPASLGAKIGDWTIRFTGRTQREAYMTGELPWIGATQNTAEVA